MVIMVLINVRDKTYLKTLGSQSLTILLTSMVQLVVPIMKNIFSVFQDTPQQKEDMLRTSINIW